MIVESPAKAHTIQKYLGPDYEVMASMGHVRDLPASRMSVDVKNDFAPNYENIKGKGELIKKLRAEAKKSDYVYLATDPDREGEAISWHLAQLLKLDETEPNRVTFNEITKSGIKYGMEHPRCIDQQLVDAQQARRVLGTASWATRSALSCGRRSARDFPPDGCNRWRCGWWWTGRMRSGPLSRRNTGPWRPCCRSRA